MRLRKFVKWGALALTVLIAAPTIRYLWITYDVPYRIAASVASSSIVRSWRCSGVDRPHLTKNDETWALTYSWAGGMGPGDFTFILNSDGRAELTSKRNGEPTPHTVEYQIAKDEVARIAAIADDTGLFCQTPILRQGYVFDLGRFSVEIISAKYNKAVFVDGCHTIPDPAALSEVSQAFIALKISESDTLAWGPYGTASVPGGCTDQESAAKQ